MIIKRLLAVLAGFLLALPCLAASLSERSAFAQGHWWNPERSGSGFDIFSASGLVAITWYTFDEAGAPIWYTALGPENSLGAQTWPLMQQSWVDGRMGQPSQVGTVKLSVTHSESMDLAWEIGGKQGTWKIQPLIVSGLVSEVDHGGSWFDRSQSGWGFGLTEQGAALGGVLFSYDKTGRPAWMTGFNTGGSRTVEFFGANGACPYCTYRTNTLGSVGTITFDFASETSATLRTRLAVGMAPGITVEGARLEMFSRPTSMRPADRQLASFDVDAAMKSYLGDGLANIYYGAAAIILPSAAPPVAPGFSTTNLQESGVDEADLVKSNGRNVYAFDYDSYGTIKSSLRVARADNEGASIQVLATVPLWGGNTIGMNTAGLYLQDERLAAVTGSQPGYYYTPGTLAVSAAPWIGGEGRVEILSIATPDAPSSLWRAQFEGYIVTSRRIGDRLYIVSRFTPAAPAGYVFLNTQAAAQTNRPILAGTPIENLLPKVRINGGAPERFLNASDVYSPPQGARRPLATMTVITAIDLQTPRIAQSLAIAGNVESVYVSSDHLFFASTRYDYRDGGGGLLPNTPASIYLTDVHQVRLGAQGMSVVGSGQLDGYLGSTLEKAAFRMSEYQGRFRAVTNSPFWGAGVNKLTIMEPSTITAGMLKTVSVLPNSKRQENLGKPGEQLYGTRFVGDRLYAVTFKLVDPLYVVDLSDSTDPRIAAALTLPGFSEYLHPLANGLLLGFGKDALPAAGVGDGQFAWYQGLQLSLYDVADAANPREIQRETMGKRGSDSALLRDHHAFSALMNPDGTGVLAIPARLNDGVLPVGSGDSAFYPWKESGLMRFELRGTGPDAKLVRLPSLITHSSSSAVVPTTADPASDAGRSIIMRNGTIYSGKGKLWRQDNFGNVTGPF